MPVRGGFRVLHPSGDRNGWRLGNACVSFRVSGKQILRILVSAGSAGFSPSGIPTPRYSQRTPAVVGVDTIQAYRHQVLEAIEERLKRLQKVGQPTSLSHLSSSSQPDPAVGRPLLVGKSWLEDRNTDVLYLIRSSRELVIEKGKEGE